jgi:hypothetical protein
LRKRAFPPTHEAALKAKASSPEFLHSIECILERYRNSDIDVLSNGHSDGRSCKQLFYYTHVDTGQLPSGATAKHSAIRFGRLDRRAEDPKRVNYCGSLAC